MFGRDIRKAMETQIRNRVKTDVLIGALSSAVDKELVLARTRKVSQSTVRKVKETQICCYVKTDVLEVSLNSAVDKGLDLAQTHKVSEG